MTPDKKSCVACAELIQPQAKLCRFCGTLQKDPRFAQGPKASQKTKANKSAETVCISCGKPNSISRKRCAGCDGWLGHDQQVSVQAFEASDNRKQGIANLGATPPIAIAAAIVAFFVPVVGLFLGYAARAEVRNPESPREGDGLATLAIVIGWIWTIVGGIWLIAMMALLVNV